MASYDALVLAMDAAGIAAMYAPDGELVDAAGQTVARGPQAIRAFLEPFAATVHVLENESIVGSVSADETTATIRGTYHQRAVLLDKDQEIEVTGLFAADWLRTPDGTWQILRMATSPS